MNRIWNLEFGIWDLGFGIWDLGFGIWDLLGGGVFFVRILCRWCVEGLAICPFSFG